MDWNRVQGNWKHRTRPGPGHYRDIREPQNGLLLTSHAAKQSYGENNRMRLILISDARTAREEE
jgi:hypothetical protein